MYDVFISYLREDKERVLLLDGELRRKNVSVFIDQSNLPIGARWREEIAEAIRGAGFVLACFSSTYEKRPDNGMLVELKYAISLRKEGNKYPEILPVKLDACNIPDIPIGENEKLSDLQWESLDNENWETGVGKLVEITLRLPKERAKSYLREKAKEVSVKNSEAVRAREVYAAHQHEEMRRQVQREIFGRNSKERWGPESFELPNVWPAQQAAQKETELEYAQSAYDKAQIEFVQKYGEEYHPLTEFFAEMAKEEQRIRKSFEEKQKAEDRDVELGTLGVILAILIVSILVVLVALLLIWLKRTLGF